MTTPLHVLVGRIYSALTVERCAQAMGIAKGTAYFYNKSAKDNGQPIPTMNLLALLEHSRDHGNDSSREAGRDIAGIFSEAAGVRSIGREVIDHINIGIAALNNGGHMPKATPATCPSCARPLRATGWIHQQPIYVCDNGVCPGKRAGL